MKTKNHVIYAEDLLWEIMQYPSKNISKSLIRECTKKVIAEKEISIWKHIRNLIKGDVHK
jgi:hypothetical protein